jgi:hypothetical protein
MSKGCKTKEYQNKIAATRIEVVRKRGRPRKRWKDEVEEDLNIMGIKYGRAAPRDRRKWRKIVLQGPLEKKKKKRITHINQRACAHILDSIISSHQQCSIVPKQST